MAADLPGRRSTLIASSLAVVVVLNVAAVNPALPSLQRAFQTTPRDLQWVVNVYNITLAALLLVGGLLGARLGFGASCWVAWTSVFWRPSPWLARGQEAWRCGGDALWGQQK